MELDYLSLNDQSECSAFAEKLNTFHQSKGQTHEQYLNCLRDYQDEIIESLGGLHNILQFCLKDEKYSSEIIIDHGNVSNLATLFDNNIDIEIESTTKLKPTSIDTKHNATVLTMQYYTNRHPIVMVNVENNFHFSQFSTQLANFLYYHIALNRKVFILSSLTSAFLGALAQFLSFISANSMSVTLAYNINMII